jgi:hypothetical protein
MITNPLINPSAGMSGSVLSLFNNNTPGLWYSPSDLTDAKIASGLTGAAFLAAYPMTALYQDAAGTTPVTALEQPVGKMLDKSGRGNHAIQSTSANRPVITSRKNLLTYTEDFGNAVWTKAGAATVSGSLVTIGGAGDLHYQLTVVSGLTYTTSFYAQASGSGTPGYKIYDVTHGLDIVAPTSYAASINPSTSTRISVSFTIPAGCTTIQVVPCLRLAGVVAVYLTYSQLEYGTTATRYQRVGAATYGTGTAAGVADYDYVNFPRFLRYNGTNSSMATAATLDLSSTAAVTVWAGVTKLSDAAIGSIFELGPSVTGVIGGFGLIASLNSTTQDYWAGVSSGAVNDKYLTGVIGGFDSPITNVISIRANKSAYPVNGSGLVYRVDSTIPTPTYLAVGDWSGNFANQILYLGARAGNALFFNGLMADTIILGALSTNAQVAQTEQYVKTKTFEPPYTW